jgi:fibronectin-binding autotransporter adhesin
MAIKYYDANAATAGFGTLGTLWNTTTANWGNTAVGNIAPTAYTFTAGADIAQFGATGTTATAGTVTIATAYSPSVNGIITQNLAGLQTIARTGTGTLTLAGTNPTITVNSAGGLRITTPIVGTAGLIKAGTGVLTLTGLNTYSGNTVLNTGTLRVGLNNPFPNSTLVLNAGTLSSDSTTGRTIGSAVNIGGDVTIGNTTNNGFIALTNTVALTSNTILRNPGGDVQLGTINNTGYNLDLSSPGGGGFRFTGATGTFNGVVKVTGSGFGFIGSYNSGTPNQFANASAVDTGVSGNGFYIEGANAYTFSTPIIGTGDLTIRNFGGVTLTNASAYSGSFRLDNGATVIFPTIAPLGEAYYLGSGTITIRYTGTTNGIINYPLRFRPWSGVATNVLHNASTNGSTLDVTNDVYLWNDGNNATFQINVDAAAGLTNISAPINQDPARILAVQKVGGGAAALSNANGYTGNTTLSAGILELRNSLAVQNSIVNLAAGTLAFSGSTAYTFGGLTGPQNLTLTNNAGQATNLTIKIANTDYGGIFSGNGNLSFTNSGSVSGRTYAALIGGAGLNTGAVVVAGSGGVTDLLLAYANNGTPNQLSSSSGISLIGTARLFVQGNTAFVFNTPITGSNIIFNRNTSADGVTYGSNLDSFTGMFSIYADGQEGSSVSKQIVKVSSFPKGNIEFSAGNFVAMSQTLRYTGTSSVTTDKYMLLQPWGTAPANPITGTLENASTNGSSINLTNLLPSVRHNQATNASLFRLNAASGAVYMTSGLYEANTGILHFEKLGAEPVSIGLSSYRGTTKVSAGVLTLTGTLKDRVDVGTNATFNYITAGHTRIPVVSLTSGSNVFGITGTNSTFIETLNLANTTTLTASLNTGSVCTLGTVSDNTFSSTGGNAWRFGNANTTRTAAITIRQGKAIVQNEAVLPVFGRSSVSISSGSILETELGSSQGAKAKYTGNLSLGTSGSGAVKAKYKIGAGVQRTIFRGTVEVAGDLVFNSATTIQLINATTYNAAGTYLLFRYTGTCTNYTNLSVSTSVAGRSVLYTRHDAGSKCIYVTLA